MFGNFSPIEKKVFLHVATADHRARNPFLSLANRLYYAHILSELGDKDVAEAIAKCCLIPDRQPMAVYCPGDDKFATKEAAEAFLRKTYREWLGVADVSLRNGFPIVVLDSYGESVDVLEYVTRQEASPRPTSRAMAMARN